MCNDDRYVGFLLSLLLESRTVLDNVATRRPYIPSTTLLSATVPFAFEVQPIAE